MAKYRGAKSYHGRTPQAKENQRKNLVPGGPWQKRSIKRLRLECWWEIADLESKQFMFEGCVNRRDSKDVSKKELKSEKYINDWWSGLNLIDKKSIYKAIMDPLPPEQKASILKDTRECLQKMLAFKGES
ncbi:hypothetical protein ES695_02800 [Candidatus Atribacteria bacterium 1244-E10-H5-B2]|nr:MAG: hypothetical protein ES695_02800 [Candidatus Atribacteria bacterium 1244-E10-H5-B2]